MGDGMSVTIKQVAQKAGVSVATVSKAINDSAEIPQETKDKVKRVIDELCYVPNKNARELKTKKTRNIIFIGRFEEGDAFEKPHIFEILCACARVTEQKGYSFELVNLRGDNTSKIEHIIGEKNACGLIIHASSLSKKLARVLERNDVPHVVIGYPTYGNTLCWVDNDNKLSGAFAAKHLVDIGKRHIAFIGGEKYDAISEARLVGAGDYLKSVGLSLDSGLCLRGQPTKEDGEYMTGKLLKSGKAVDGIICANNGIALGAISCLVGAGVVVPDDIAVISFDKYPYSQITNPPLTVVDINVYDLGIQAAAMLINKIKKPELHFALYSTLSRVIVRGSTVKQ